jgi:dUTP pyrophosphatase
MIKEVNCSAVQLGKYQVDGQYCLYLHFLAQHLREAHQMDLSYLVVNDDFYIKCTSGDTTATLTLSVPLIQTDWLKHGAKKITQFINKQLMQKTNTKAIPAKVKLDPGASLPTRAHDGDTGYDVKVRELYVIVKCQGLIDVIPSEEDPIIEHFRYGAIHTLKIKVNNRQEIADLLHAVDKKDTSCISHRKWQITGLELRTGVHIQLPPGWGIQARACSRLGKTEYNLPFGLGTIDQPYTGDIRFIYHRDGAFGISVSDIAMFLPGNTAGQFVLEPVYDMDMSVVDKLDETDRGAGGFGSTANKA